MRPGRPLQQQPRRPADPARCPRLLPPGAGHPAPPSRGRQRSAAPGRARRAAAAAASSQAGRTRGPSCEPGRRGSQRPPACTRPHPHANRPAADPQPGAAPAGGGFRQAWPRSLALPQQPAERPGLKDG